MGEVDEFGNLVSAEIRAKSFICGVDGAFVGAQSEANQPEAFQSDSSV
jgi:hypothetical protein